MTGQELIARLIELEPDELQLPVAFPDDYEFYWNSVELVRSRIISRFDNHEGECRVISLEGR